MNSGENLNIDPDDPEMESTVETDPTGISSETSKNDPIIEFKPNLVLQKAIKSDVWKHFVFKGTKSKGPNKTKVHCLLCSGAKKDLELPYSGGTTNLIFHLRHHHPENFNQKAGVSDPPAKITAYFGPNNNNNKSPQYKWPKSSTMWKNSTEALAIWLCKDTRPSSVVEDKGFRKLMAMLCPDYEVPCHQTITTYIAKIYDEKKKTVKADLEKAEFVAVTTDGGASSNAVSFQDTNAHFLDEELNMQCYTLGVRENKEKHTAENFRNKNDELLEEFAVKEKVVKTVTDNEAKMKAAYSDEEREGCIAQIFHSSISKGCDQVAVVKQTIQKTRKIAKKHNKSYALRYGVQAAQKKRKIRVAPLQQDVVNRWGSTRASLESFLDEKKSKKNILEEEGDEELEGEDTDKFINCEAVNEALRGIKYKKKSDVYSYLLSNADMNRIKAIHKFLTKLDIFTTTLGGNSFVSTISVVLPVVKSMMSLLKPEEEDFTYIADLKKTILEDFKLRIQDNLDLDFLIKTVALDPRFKNMKVVDEKQKREQTFKDLETEMRDHKEKKKEEEDHLQKESVDKKRKLCLDFPESDDEEDESDDISKEMSQYKSEPMLDKDCDPLAWWRKKRDTYPNLVRLVRKYLCVPATSTQAERIFSALGLLLTKRRLSMTGENVNRQLFLKGNLKD